MYRVYCDTGGYRKELLQLEKSGVIQLTTYAYENSTKKIKGRSPGSNPSWDEGDSTWDVDDGSWDDSAKVSDQWEKILNLVGTQNQKDAKHLDSAYMAECNIFLTSDFDDISSKAKSILSLLGIHVFHSTKDWDAFLDFMKI